jgi:hypothetical protein
VDWVIKSIDAVGHNRSSLKKIQFNSGSSELNEYLKMYAWKNNQNGVAKVFVSFLQENGKILKAIMPLV